MNEKMLCRDGSIDAVRVLAMLSIIKIHSQIVSPLWTFHATFLSAWAGVCFFFFAAALFSKRDWRTICTRGLWMGASCVLWIFLLYFILNPLADALSHWLVQGCWRMTVPSITHAPYNRLLLWDWTQMFPIPGHMWFLRLLCALTFATVLLIKLPNRLLIVLGVIFWCVRYTPLVTNAEYKSFLPFILTGEASSASVAAYCFGLAMNKSGGLKAFQEMCRGLLYPSFFLIALSWGRLLVSMPDEMIDIINFLYPFALCSLLAWFFKKGAGKALNGFVIKLAPGVFCVYVLHPVVAGIIYQIGLSCFTGAWMKCYDTLSMVAVMAVCYGLYRLLRKIPKCSMLLCFSK